MCKIVIYVLNCHKCDIIRITYIYTLSYNYIKVVSLIVALYDNRVLIKSTVTYGLMWCILMLITNIND